MAFAPARHLSLRREDRDPHPPASSLDPPISSASAYLETASHMEQAGPSTALGRSATSGARHYANYDHQHHDISHQLEQGHGRRASQPAVLPSAMSQGTSAPRPASEVNAALLNVYKHTIAECESYLSVFEARARLEEDFVKGLKSISEKSRDNVLRLDGRSMLHELPGASRAWREMLQSNMREMDARMHYVETLKQGVIAPLVLYRDAQERIRKRVKEDVKTSIAAYDEMRNHTLPRAKKVYEKKCEEVEQIRMQQQAVEDQKLLLSQNNTPQHESLPIPPASGEVFSPTSSAAHSEQDDDVRSVGEETAATSPGRSSSLKATPISRRGGSTGSESSAQHYSDGVSPRMGGDASLPSSPPMQNTSSMGSEKKGHFLDALRSRENWEAARKEAPKKLNALINRMRDTTGIDKGDSAGSVFAISPDSQTSGLVQGMSIGGTQGALRSSQNIALRHAKAKREAEEADVVYRKAVFDLETLRLRREKTLQAARTTILDARRELHQTCQAIWTQAEKSAQSLSNANLSCSMHSEDVLRHSLDNLDMELEALNARLPIIDEERVRYVNFQMGECKDLIFGVSLVDYAFSRAQQSAPQIGPGKAEAPLIVRKCIALIERKALDQPGIYRTSAKYTAIQNLAHALERDEERFDFSAADDDPATVAGVLKLYLRELPDPVLPMPWEERVKYTHERDEHIRTGFASLKGRIRRLPPVNQATLRVIVEHLANVAAHSEQNRMTASNLSIIFGPLLLSQADHDTMSIAAAMEEDRVTEDLITYADVIFDLSRAGAPVLPPVASNTSDATWQDLAADVQSTGIDDRTPTDNNIKQFPATGDESKTDLQSTLDSFPVPAASDAGSIHGSQIAVATRAPARFSLDDASIVNVAGPNGSVPVEADAIVQQQTMLVPSHAERPPILTMASVASQPSTIDDSTTFDTPTVDAHPATLPISTPITASSASTPKA